MSSRNGCSRCNNNSSSNSSDEYWPTPWYCKLIKPLTFFIVTTMLAISAVHLWGEYSASDSFWMIKSDLGKLRSQLSTLTMEVKNIIETRDELRSKLREVGCVVPKMSEAIVKLREEVSEEIGAHTKIVLNALSPDNVRDMVKSELQTYDADKTGRTDYALESLGGSIISTRDTELYTAGAPVLSFFGIPLCPQQNTPRTVIQAGSLPGECWAFKGTTGSVAIRLMGHVRVTGVSLEHISSSISPDGETTAAPRDFSVWGLHHVDDNDGFLFGEFTYNNRAPATPVQYFPVQFQPEEPYELIELRIHSNSGNSEYTCVYRIRVHGSLEARCHDKPQHSSSGHSLIYQYHTFAIDSSFLVSSYVLLLLLYVYVVHFFYPLVVESYFLRG